jgi:hypothetical protein
MTANGVWVMLMYAVWMLDFVFAYVLGIVFQYYAIVPMRGLSPRGAGRPARCG